MESTALAVALTASAIFQRTRLIISYIFPFNRCLSLRIKSICCGGEGLIGSDPDPDLRSMVGILRKPHHVQFYGPCHAGSLWKNPEIRFEDTQLSYQVRSASRWSMKLGTLQKK